MHKRSGELLNKFQREEFLNSIFSMNTYELGAFYMLSKKDLKIISSKRRNSNRLGFAVQLCLCRYPGFLPDNLSIIPISLITFISKQLGLMHEDFKNYSLREATLYEHRAELQEKFGFQVLNKKNEYKLQVLLVPFIERGYQTTELLIKLLELCRIEGIVVTTTLSNLEHIISKTCQKVEINIQNILTQNLTSEQKDLLDNTLKMTKDKYLSDFGWLKKNIGKTSVSSFHEILKKLHYLEKFYFIPEDLDIPIAKVKEFINLGTTYEASSLKKLSENKRFSILIVFFHKLRKTLIDMGIQIHMYQMKQVKKKSQRKLESLQKNEVKSFNQKVIKFIEIGEILIEAKKEKLNPYKILEQKIGWDKILLEIEDAKKLAKLQNFSYLNFIDTRYNYLRNYSPDFLKHFEFIPIKSSLELMKAIDVLRLMNNSKSRKLPVNIPINFLPKKWKDYVIKKDGKICKRHYEMAILDEINNEIKAGNIAVRGSEQYQNFENYLISKEEFKITDYTNYQLNFKTYIKERKEKLQSQIELLKIKLPTSKTAYGINGKIYLRKLSSEIPNNTDKFINDIFKKIPQIKLTNMLLEVSKWTNFTNEFRHLSNGKIINESELPILLSTLLALGTNIGLSKMADHTYNTSYHQLAYVSQWYLQEDSLRRAIAHLVNFQHHRSLASYWGDGTTSSSDGMRMKVPVSSFHAKYSEHLGFEKGVTVYRAVADQFQSYYTKIINIDSREAVHVLDTLLSHHTELDIKEHYTDTHGYTDQVFALCHMFGIKFAPRIKGISDLRLFYADKIDSCIKEYFHRKINFNIIERNFEDILRLIFSIHEGITSSSFILSKLGSYARKNSLAQALRELGRIEKTIYLIEYFLDADLRHRVQKGLNKGESVNALSRKLNFGQQNEYYEASYIGQTQKSLASDLLINIITVWNTVYMEAAIKELEKEGKNEPV